MTFSYRLANITLFILVLTYIAMLGGGCYESINVTPTIASAPPRSLAMLQGPYGFNPIRFWVLFRPVTILFFLLALTANWKVDKDRKIFLLVAFCIDLLITVATFGYFAPETGVIAGATFHAETVDIALAQRAGLWEKLNLLRLGAFAIAATFLLFALNKNIKMKA